MSDLKFDRLLSNITKSFAELAEAGSFATAVMAELGRELEFDDQPLVVPVLKISHSRPLKERAAPPATDDGKTRRIRIEEG